jgi:hypothetical protein
MINRYGERSLIIWSVIYATVCFGLYTITYLGISLSSASEKKYYLPVEFPDFFVAGINTANDHSLKT